MNRYSLPLLGWVIATLILTWMPGDALHKPEFLDFSFIDLVAHFGIFMVFSYLFAGTIYYNKNRDLPRNKFISIVVIVSLIFNCITESGQIFIPGRFFQFLDIIVNFLGSLIGIGLFFMKLKYFSK